MSIRVSLAGFLAAAAILVSLPAGADDVIKVRLMGSDLAADIARATVKSCRAKGYQVAAVVLDRAGDIMAAQRDTLARRHTLEIAERKAGLVVLSGADSGEMRAQRGDIRAELNEMRGLIVMEGGIQIRAAGSLIGAVGVSGAPGGDIDAACARDGLAAVQDRLDFVD
ncbi:MAG: heme-binding protein [Rhodospirillaceae bacterium]